MRAALRQLGGPAALVAVGVLAGLVARGDAAPTVERVPSAQRVALDRRPPEPKPAPRKPPPKRVQRPPAMRERVDDARRIAESAGGAVSFAVVGADGRLRGHAEHATYPSASLVKAMLLAAETRRLHASGATMDSATAQLLRAMITYSDNDAASTIFARVGAEGLYSVAERAGMTDFTVGFVWGAARISAADMALLFADLDGAFPAEHREFAKGLLGSVVPEQSWGLPAAVPKGWNVRFKGGWFPGDAGQITHQAGELQHGERELAIAVLTNHQPSFEAGVGLIEGIGRKLVG